MRASVSISAMPILSIKLSIRNAVVAALVVAALGTTIVPRHAMAQSEPLESSSHGITLLALPPGPGVSYDVPIVGQLEAMDSLVKAINAIYKESPFNTAQIETLKNNGEVIVAYDPRYPDRNDDLDAVRLAAYRPNYFKEYPTGEIEKAFKTIIGRHGIKWPLRELAAIIVHELVGHGMQDLRGAQENTRHLDLECEAWLYQEMAYQDFRIDKLSRDMVLARQQLEEFNCYDFKQYMKDHHSSMVALWDVLNPDVPRLLAIYKEYVIYLRDQGISRKAVQAAKLHDEAEVERKLREIVTQHPGQAVKLTRKAAMRGYAFAQATLGVLYLKGRGVSQDPTEAAKWYRKAAEQDYARAQTALGFLYAKGLGVPKDYVQAHFWFDLATYKLPPGELRNNTAQNRRHAASLMTPAQIAEAQRLAREWINKRAF